MLNSQAPLNLSVCSQRSDPCVSVKWQRERDHSGAQHANEQTTLRKRKFKSHLLYSKQVASQPLWSWYKNESHLLPAMKTKNILYFLTHISNFYAVLSSNRFLFFLGVQCVTFSFMIQIALSASVPLIQTLISLRSLVVEFVTLFIFTGSSPPLLESIGINTICSKEQQFLKGTTIVWGMLSQ